MISCLIVPINEAEELAHRLAGAQASRTRWRHHHAAETRGAGRKKYIRNDAFPHSHETAMNYIPWRWILYSHVSLGYLVQPLLVIITMDRNIDLSFYPYIHPIEQSPKQKLYIYLGVWSNII